MGIGLKPGTLVDVVLPYVKHVDMVLIMAVEPGFGGQKFMDDMMPKVPSSELLYCRIRCDHLRRSTWLPQM